MYDVDEGIFPSTEDGFDVEIDEKVSIFLDGNVVIWDVWLSFCVEAKFEGNFSVIVDNFLELEYFDT